MNQSAWDRFTTWILALLGDFLEWLPELDVSPWVPVMLAVLLAVLVLARMATAGRSRAAWQATEQAAPGRRADAWHEAERLAAAGDHTAAAHALCEALLLSCAARGELRLHPSKTTGDYARELRRRPAPSAAGFQRFRARYDRVLYDLQRCSPEEYAALLAEAMPIVAQGRAA
ncbi:MAG TPA: DUF4129 domain-containing protein [Kofleriaceae bacterium]|nr:DUF4129 domain-containing protein [Kofleriaceae bacterium]